MRVNLTRLAAAAAVGTMGVLAPVASASAATPPTKLAFPMPAYKLPTLAFPKTGLPSFPAAGVPSFPASGLSFVGPSVGGLAAVIGPTVITVGAGNIFTGTTITTTGGGAIVGTGTAGP